MHDFYSTLSKPVMLQLGSELAVHFGFATLYLHQFLMFNRYILLSYQENILLYLF
jgi:hypothetical protein